MYQQCRTGVRAKKSKHLNIITMNIKAMLPIAVAVIVALALYDLVIKGLIVKVAPNAYDNS